MSETAEAISNHQSPTIADAPIHLARCASCDFSVRFRPSSNGTGFVLLDSDRALGIGDAGRPLCPNAHGEMELADDQLPIEQAIGQVAEQLDAEAQRLPFPPPPFNVEGALHSLYAKRHDIAELEKRVEHRKAALKDAKDDLDQANKQLGEMLDNYEQHETDRLHEIARREAAAAAGYPAMNLVRCGWESLHPGEPCPVCTDAELVSPFARDSTAHLNEVEDVLKERDVSACEVALEEASIVIDRARIARWNPDERAAVRMWAVAVAANEPNVTLSPRPDVLGRMHVAGPAIVGQAQACTQCDAVLTAGSDDEADYYVAGWLVGTDCKNAPPARYAKRAKKTAPESLAP